MGDKRNLRGLYRLGQWHGEDGRARIPGGKIVPVLAFTLYVFIGGYALFLLGFAIFMYFENQKFGDNQFTMKLLPPPSRTGSAARAVAEAALAASRPSGDWTPVAAPHAEKAPAPAKTASSLR